MSWSKTVPQGPKGDKGLTAYQIAVNGGFVGTEAEWLLSLEGAKGEPGIDGTGSGTVSSVNDVEPDANGNVALPLSSEPDLTDYAKKTELSTLSQRQAWTGKPSLSDSEMSESATTAASNRLVKRAFDRADAAFTQASNGKNVIATAITGKGVNASGSDTFQILGNKISQIPSGKKSAEVSLRVINNSYLLVNGLDFIPRTILGEIPGGASTFKFSTDSTFEPLHITTTGRGNLRLNAVKYGEIGIFSTDISFVTGINYKLLISE